MRTALASAALVATCLASPGLAQVKLELKHPENNSTTHKTTVKVHQTLTIGGQDVVTDSEQAVTSSESNGARRPDGSLPSVRKIEGLKVQVDAMGQNVLSFDSANPAGKSDNPQLAVIQDTFKALVGASYTVVFDKAGKVVAVEGAEKALEKTDGLDAGAVAELKKAFAAEKLKKDAEQDAGRFPDILLRKGEPWERTETNNIGGGQTLTFKRQYEYLGTVEEEGKTLDKIGVKALSVVYSMDPDTPTPAKVTKSDLKVDSSEGTILFDRQAGRPVKSESKVRMKGDMTLEINGMELPSKLDLTMEQETVLQPSK
jgi:hypothetical protein